MQDANANVYEDVNEDGSIEGLEASFVEVDGITDRVDGIRTRYYEYGDGDLLVLLHGGGWSGTANANTWSRVIKGLSENFHVLAPDRLGCGMTDNPDSEEDYVYGAELEHIISFINTVGDDEVHIGGQSRGGGLAGRVAAEIPDRIKTLTVVNSATLSPTAPEKDFFYNRILRDAPEDRNSPSYHADHFQHVYSLHEYSPHHVTEEFAKASGYMATRPKAKKTAEIMEEQGGKERWLETLYEHMSKSHHRIKMGELQMPILLYWGVNDPSVPFDACVSLYRLLARRNPRVEMSVINRAGHHPYREYPEAFIDRLTSFIEFNEEHGFDYGEPEITYDY